MSNIEADEVEKGKMEKEGETLSMNKLESQASALQITSHYSEIATRNELCTAIR